MRNVVVGVTFIALLTALAPARADVVIHAPEVYEGPCDASAAVALTDGLFLMASDDDNRLRVYRTNRPSAAVAESDVLYRFLGIDPADPHQEADIEGATWLGDRIYWITSHGRDEDGVARPNRYRLFAVTLRFENGALKVDPVGKAFNGLVDDLLASPGLSDFHLGDAVRPGVQTVAALASKGTGLNIEGLAATPTGQLLIGFRSPRPTGKALVVTVENPNAIIDKGAHAQIGAHYLLDLGGLGVRSIEYAPARSAYLIIAGPGEETGEFKLYQWSGRADDAPLVLTTVPMLNPEALIVFPTRTDIELLSDDGNKKMHDAANCPPSAANGTCECKHLKPAAQRFRSVWFTFD